MFYYRVLVASSRFHGQDSLTYQSANKLKIGQLVEAKLQKLKVLGVVESAVAKPEFTTKSVERAFDVSIPDQLIQLIHWLTKYYPAPLGSIVELFTPPPLPKTVNIPEVETLKPIKTLLPSLTTEQRLALDKINARPLDSILLHGNTGTGKTRVYLELALEALGQNRSVIVLTPEIGLTAPLLQVFSEQFGSRCLVIHSGMTAAERRKIWLQIASSNQPLVVIGPRSALFTPLKNVGLIVMDEAHDSAYKQEQQPYYQTSRVAAYLAKLHNAQFVMGSATPNIVDYYTFRQKKLPIVRLVKSAIPTSAPLEQTIIDQRDRAQFRRSPWIAEKLLIAIDESLNNHEQSLLFLNRRGTARMIVCQKCGWRAHCPNCDTTLVYHGDEHLIRCHSCEFKQNPPGSCPNCGASEVVFKSIGTKALESEIRRLYSNARVARFDRDTLRAERLHLQFEDIASGKVDIVIGTQVIAKGLDLPKLGVLGVIQADSGLQLPDYSASERTFQLLTQVSGRVGRGHRPGKMFLQTFQPDSQLLSQALSKDYEGFYSQELKQRQMFQFSPYYFLLKISFARKSRKAAQTAAEQLAEKLRQNFPEVILEGPTPRFVEKIAERFSWHIVVKAKQRHDLLEIVKQLPSSCTYDLEPNNLL